MTKVCLISLPNPILNSPRMEVPLGLLYIGAVLDKEGHDVYIADMRAEKGVNMNIVPTGYDIYGVSATTGEYHYAKEVGLKLAGRDIDHHHGHHHNSILVIGGAHVTHRPIQTLKDTCFDIACIGEGEQTMLDIANMDVSKDFKIGNIYDIEGIAFRGRQDNGNDSLIIVNKERELIKDLDSIPFPGRHLLPYDHVFTKDLYYGARYGYGDVGTAIITSRGCPYRCAYCANWDRKLRLRSIDNVIKEIEECIERFQCRQFRIVDDEFGLPEKRFIDLCEAMAAIDGGIKFRTHTRTDLVTKELLTALKKAGCEEISFGMETPDENILKLINKKQTELNCRNAVRIAKAVGLRAKCYLMVCLPGETWDSIEKVKRFVEEERPDKWTLSTCIPYPGCDLEKNPDKYGIKIIESDYSKYWLYQDDPMFETKECGLEELKSHRIDLMNWLLEYDKRKNIIENIIEGRLNGN